MNNAEKIMLYRKTMTIMAEIDAELHVARTEFPESTGSMTALTEEVGELAKALLDEPWSHVRKEAIQVAVMAIRVAIEGDATLYAIRAKRGLDFAEVKDGA